MYVSFVFSALYMRMLITQNVHVFIMYVAWTTAAVRVLLQCAYCILCTVCLLCTSYSVCTAYFVQCVYCSSMRTACYVQCVYCMLCTVCVLHAMYSVCMIKCDIP